MPPEKRSSRRAEVAGPFLESAADLQCAVGIGVGHEDRELVAADPKGAIGIADDFRDEAPKVAQQLVAGRVAVAVVEHLQVVEVDQQQGHRHLVTVVPLELTLELLLERAVIAKASQAVTQGVGTSTFIELSSARPAIGREPQWCAGCAGAATSRLAAGSAR